MINCNWQTCLRKFVAVCCACLVLCPCQDSLNCWQGYGTLLMEEAERLVRREHRSNKLAVISGVGTRHYYRKLGYHLEGHYMVKHLR